jgi:hypothetical protein
MASNWRGLCPAVDYDGLMMMMMMNKVLKCVHITALICRI